MSGAVRARRDGASMTPPTVVRHQFTHRLDQEWARLRRGRHGLALVRTWPDGSPGDPLAPLVASIDDLDTLVAATHGRSARADAVLLRLVEVAQHDQLAGRIVIQRLLPPLIASSVRYRDSCEGCDPAELVVPAAWLALRRYDHVRRCRHVAASLVSDAVFAAFRQPMRRRSRTEEPHSPRTFEELLAGDEPPVLVELAHVLRDATAGGVAPEHVELLRASVAISPSELARRRAVTTRTIRNQRRRAVDAVRGVLAA